MAQGRGWPKEGYLPLYFLRHEMFIVYSVRYTERNNWWHAHGTHKMSHTCQMTIVKNAYSNV